QADLLKRLRIHEVITFRVAIKVFKFNVIEHGPLYRILSAKSVVDDGTASQAAHLCGHCAALVPRRAVIHAVYGIKVAFVQNNHSWTQLRRLHQFLLGRRMVRGGSITVCGSRGFEERNALSELRHYSRAYKPWSTRGRAVA